MNFEHFWAANCRPLHHRRIVSAVTFRILILPQTDPSATITWGLHLSGLLLIRFKSAFKSQQHCFSPFLYRYIWTKYFPFSADTSDMWGLGDLGDFGGAVNGRASSFVSSFGRIELNKCTDIEREGAMLIVYGAYPSLKGHKTTSGEWQCGCHVVLRLSCSWTVKSAAEYLKRIWGLDYTT